MPPRKEDQYILKRNKRRLQLIAVPSVIVFVAAWWLGYVWLEGEFGLARRVAQAASLLFVSVLALPADHVWRFNRTASPRHRALLNDWLNQRLAKLRPLFVVYLVFNILLTLSALRHPHRGLATDDPLNLTIVTLTCLEPWRLNLFFPRSFGPVDELVQFELLQSAVRGFATLVVLSLAAAIGNDARPGTLHVTLPAALLLSALVAQLSLWAQNRRAKRDTDDE